MSDRAGSAPSNASLDPCHPTALRVHLMETGGSDRTCKRPRRRLRARPAARSRVSIRRTGSSSITITPAGSGAGPRRSAGPEPAAKAPEYERKVRRTVEGDRGQERSEDRAALDYLTGSAHENRAIPTTYNSPGPLLLCLASVAMPGCCCWPDLPRTTDRVLRPPRRSAWPRRIPVCRCGMSGTRIAAGEGDPQQGDRELEADFLVFIDGDVLIHPGFIARHVELARPGGSRPAA